MDCLQAENLATLVLIDDPTVSVADQVAFDLHLQTCTSCREAFAESRRVMEMVREYGKLSPDTVEMLESQGYGVADHLRPESREEITLSEDEIESGLASLMAKIDEIEAESVSETDEPAPMSLEDGVADLRRRVNTLEAQQHHWREQWMEEDQGDTWDSFAPCSTNHKSGQIDLTKTLSAKRIRRIAVSLTLAACLAMLAMVWFVYRPVQLTTQSLSIAKHNQATLELITETGLQSISLDTPIHSHDGIMELLLGSKHKVVLNRSTTVTVTAKYRGNGKSPQWLIDLQSGELYAEVVPNLQGGTKFAIKTPNALATITGTKFNIQVHDQKTELTLLQGSVRFASPDDRHAVDVTTSYASTVTGINAPTLPHPVDAMTAVAWIKPSEITLDLPANAAGTFEPLTDGLGSDAFLPFTPDYRTWTYDRFRDKMRPWFAERFPWAMKLEKALNEKHDIDADYLDVLVISGDVWQFHYSDTSSDVATVFDPMTVNYLAKWYGLHEVDGYKLAESKGLEFIETASDFSEEIHRWQVSILRQLEKPNSTALPMPNKVLDYLQITRSAIYLWIAEHPEEAQLLWGDLQVIGHLPPIGPAESVSDIKAGIDSQLTACYSCQLFLWHALVHSDSIFSCPTGSDNYCRKFKDMLLPLIGEKEMLP